MNFDSQGLEILDEEECLRLLATTPLGRVVFTASALPAIQPVNFALDGDRVVLRTNSGTRLARATRDTIVAFEADAFDAATRTGWSVTIVGEAQAITDPDALDRLSRLPLESWAPGPRDHYVQIIGRFISGRRIPARAAA